MCIIIVGIIAMTGWTGATAEAGDEPRPDNGVAVAHTMAKVAMYVFNADFVADGVAEHFTADELQIVAVHLGPVAKMTSRALETQSSVGGAKLAAHFRIGRLLPQLRDRLLESGMPYGWEGSDYSNPEAYLDDSQFVYHLHYVEAIATITNRPIHEAVELADDERQRINRLAAADVKPGQNVNTWARWMQRKLQITP